MRDKCERFSVCPWRGNRNILLEDIKINCPAMTDGDCNTIRILCLDSTPYLCERCGDDSEDCKCKDGPTRSAIAKSEGKTDLLTETLKATRPE